MFVDRTGMLTLDGLGRYVVEPAKPFFGLGRFEMEEARVLFGELVSQEGRTLGEVPEGTITPPAETQVPEGTITPPAETQVPEGTITPPAETHWYDWFVENKTYVIIGAAAVGAYLVLK